MLIQTLISKVHLAQILQQLAKDIAHSAVIPNFYVSHKYSEKLAIGFAAGTNYGMETDLGKDFAGANHGNEASVIRYGAEPKCSLPSTRKRICGWRRALRDGRR